VKVVHPAPVEEDGDDEF